MSCPSITAAVSIEGAPSSRAAISLNQYLRLVPHLFCAVCGFRRCFILESMPNLVILLICASTAEAEVVTFQQGVNGYTHQDATVRTDQPTVPNNSTRVLCGTLIDHGGILRTLFSFPLPGIQPGSVINSVKLTMGQDPDTGASESADF